MLVSARSIGKRYGTETVLNDISCSLDEGHKVALVGKNGSGKSTLMRIIAGIEEPDSGSVTITRGRKVAYLPQEAGDGDRSGIEYIREGIDLPPHRYAPILEGLGVAREVADQKMGAMSGGQRTKILLTRFLLEPSDILLLDEPTNNLDIPSLLWLEAFLAATKKTMIIVSHDIVFLDAVTNRVFELKDGSLVTERGTYGEYIERKRKEMIRQAREYREYEEEIQKLEDAGRDLRGKGGRIDATETTDSDKISAGARRDRASAGQKQARAIERRIQRIKKVEKPYEEEPFTIAIPADRHEGTVEITAENVVAGYAGGNTVGPVSFSLKRGDRMCLLGMNGAGKSAMLKTITGAIKPLEGEITVTENAVFGDMMQEHERADRNEEVIRLYTEQTGANANQALHALARAGFTERETRQKVGDLSAGTRARLLFAIFEALGVNALILDEPTNHLDMDAVTALKDMLKTYAGIVIAVSHNRWFLKRVRMDTYHEIVDGKLRRIKDFGEYVGAARDRAETMIARMKRATAK